MKKTLSAEPKPTKARKTRVSKRSIEVIPIDQETVEVTVPEEKQERQTTQVTEPKEMTAEDKAAIVQQYLREQQLNKRAVKQQKYKQLITSAF
jgi:hypothetical protein